MSDINKVMEHYDNNVQKEWERLARHYFEFEITKNYMDKYIEKGDSVLDVSGGPGRYSIYLAQKGCDVTLVDLSPKNAEFAKQKANELGLNMNVLVGDACEVDKLISEQFDHVFLMGALYHLKDENLRIAAVESCLKLLKPNGLFYASFISVIAGMIYMMKEEPAMVLEDSEQIFIENFINNKEHSGSGFTEIYFAQPENIISLMKLFKLEQMHLFGQEGITSPCEDKILASDKDTITKWLDISLKACERQDLLNYSEHIMYIGRKL